MNSSTLPVGSPSELYQLTVEPPPSDGRRGLGFPPDADGNGNYAFFDAANYALIQMTGGVTAISAV